jgi:Phage tail assembly chaperone protein, TAC
MAFGSLGLRPAEFWPMTLAEWRATLEGFAHREKGEMRKRAWTVSHSLIAAGCKPEHVTVEKLLGEKEPRRRPRKTREEHSEDEAKKIWARVQRDREKAAAAAGEVK